MSEVEHILLQMRRAFQGEAWHGPSLQEALRGLRFSAAASRAVPGAHSIWEIVLHLLATQALVLRRLAGDARPLRPAEDWPMLPDPDDEQAWQRTLAELAAGEEALREEVAKLPAGRLEHSPVPGGSSAREMLHGYVQHLAYHTGQIVLLRTGQQH